MAKEKAAPKEPKAPKAPKVADAPEGIVLYTDGSVRPVNPGYGGFGIHGYSWMAKASKGNGNPTIVVTDKGYVNKSEGKETSTNEVKTLSYFDGYGSFGMPISNNYAELAGAVTGVDYALKFDVKKLLVLTDSEYVIRGVKVGIPTWKTNGWVKRDGTLIASKELWQQMDKGLQALDAKGIKFNISWVKGHSDHLGNQIADKHAAIGSTQSGKHVIRTEINQSAADGYWTKKVDRHPFINLKALYFCSNPELNVKGEYYLGDHGKLSEMIGNRQTDGRYAYVELKEPDPILEILKARQCEEANGLDVLIFGMLNNVYSRQIANDLMMFGGVCMVRMNHKKLDLRYIEREPKIIPLTEELTPPKLAFRAFDAVGLLKQMLEAYKNKDDTTITVTDITSLIYSKDDKGKTTLAPNISQADSVLPAAVAYGKKGKTAHIDLSMRVDIPDRNVFKSLELLSPTVAVVSWMESEKAFRYATIVHEGDNYGIWAGMYSNTRFIL